MGNGWASLGSGVAGAAPAAHPPCATRTERVKHVQDCWGAPAALLLSCSLSRCRKDGQVGFTLGSGEAALTPDFHPPGAVSTAARAQCHGAVPASKTAPFPVFPPSSFDTDCQIISRVDLACFQLGIFLLCVPSSHVLLQNGWAASDPLSLGSCRPQTCPTASEPVPCRSYILCPNGEWRTPNISPPLFLTVFFQRGFLSPSLLWDQLVKVDN